MAISAAQVIAQTDKYTAAYLALKGDGSSYGDGDSSQSIGSDWGLSRKFRDAEALALAFSNVPDGLKLGNALQDAINKATYQNDVQTRFHPLYTIFSNLCGQAGISGVSDLVSFLNYYNIGAGGPYAALMCPDFTTLYNLITGHTLARTNIFSPAITDMGHRLAGGSFVPGTAATIGVVAVLNAVVTSFAGSSDTVTVVTDGCKADGTPYTGHNFTGTVSATGTVALTPATTGDRATAVTGITIGTNITASTLITIACATPRTNPPS